MLTLHCRCLSPYQRTPILVKYNEMLLLFIDKERNAQRVSAGNVVEAAFHRYTIPILQP